MSEVATHNSDKSFPEIRDVVTRRGTWIWVLGFLTLLIVALFRPFLWEFALLCCFPAPLFCYGAVRSGVIRRPGMMKIVIVVSVVHCLLLAGTLYLWKVFPERVGGDFGFLFVMIEVAVIAILMHSVRTGGAGGPNNRSR